LAIVKLDVEHGGSIALLPHS